MAVDTHEILDFTFDRLTKCRRQKVLEFITGEVLRSNCLGIDVKNYALQKYSLHFGNFEMGLCGSRLRPQPSQPISNNDQFLLGAVSSSGRVIVPNVTVESNWVLFSCEGFSKLGLGFKFESEILICEFLRTTIRLFFPLRTELVTCILPPDP